MMRSTANDERGKITATLTVTNSLKSIYSKSLYPHPTNTMTQIALSDFPETIQALLTQAIQTGEPLTIAQNDRPVAIISPIQKSKRAAFGSAKDSGKIIGDIVEPTSIMPCESE
jgi:antitoxin (DNA-binding transcriptional repressor) of toxin-antitoxin stability system